MSMKAIVQRKWGGPENFEVAQIPKPTPLPRDLLVRVKATAMNPIDAKVRGAKFPCPPSPPENFVIGFDGAGVVEAVGSDAKLFKVGDEVYFSGVINRNGTNAEYTVVDERIVGRKPKNFTFEQAAAIPLCGLTAWEGLVELMGLQPHTDNSDKSILIIAGAGGVGSITIPLAKKVFKFGKVIATASRPETKEYVKQIGAGLADQLKEAGYTDGVPYIFDCGATPAKDFDKVAATLSYNGKIILITFGGDEHPTAVPHLYFKRCTIGFEFMFAKALLGIDMESQHHILNYLAELTEKGFIPDRAKTILSLKTQVAEAHNILDSGKAIGKVVMTVDL